MLRSFPSSILSVVAYSTRHIFVSGFPVLVTIVSLHAEPSPSLYDYRTLMSIPANSLGLPSEHSPHASRHRSIVVIRWTSLFLRLKNILPIVESSPRRSSTNHFLALDNHFLSSLSTRDSIHFSRAFMTKHAIAIFKHTIAIFNHHVLAIFNLVIVKMLLSTARIAFFNSTILQLLIYYSAPSPPPLPHVKNWTFFDARAAQK